MYQILFYLNHFSSIHREIPFACWMIFIGFIHYCVGLLVMWKTYTRSSYQKRHAKEFSNISPNEICTQAFCNIRAISNLMVWRRSVSAAYFVNWAIVTQYSFKRISIDKDLNNFWLELKNNYFSWLLCERNTGVFI